MLTVNGFILFAASFDYAQRQATENAAVIAGLLIAGLQVIRLIDELVAAAIAYGLHQKNGEKKILVFHLGGRTCNATILRVNEGKFHVLVT